MNKAGESPAFESIPVILQVAGALAAPVRPGHIAIYAPGDLRSGRLPATQIILGTW